MRVFVTGATGWVGSAVVQELLGHGYQVLGLARSDAGAAKLAATGADVLRGELMDLDTLRRGAAETDGVIHTAFIHDFSKFVENCEIDARAIEALGETLAGSERPLIVTNGVGFLVQGRAATEDDPALPASSGYPRQSESAGFAWVARGVRAMAVRLPPSVHGAGDHGFVPNAVHVARMTGQSAYVGDGLNRWAGVTRNDAAIAYRLVLEKGVAGGHYHAVAEEGVPFKDIAGVIGHRLGLPVVSKTPEEAQAHFGWFARFAGMSAAASSTRTREALGWMPAGPGLLADIEQAGYLDA
jgi:nucleoside-diphosphate-sugar epimerase